MNKVILMGRLTRDAEVRYSQGESSSAIARFTLAVDRRFRRNNEDQTADFISCVAFSKTAEFLERFGRKEPSSFSRVISRQAVIQTRMDSAFTPQMLWQRT